jgi:hypothetical protein
MKQGKVAFPKSKEEMFCDEKSWSIFILRHKDARFVPILSLLFLLQFFSPHFRHFSAP